MIYLLRHSTDDNSIKGGWSKVKLSKEGKVLAKQTAKILQNYSFEKIICSDLVRAKQTCKIINQTLNLPVTFVKDLREFNAGIVSGMNCEKANKLYPICEKDYNNMDFKYPKGETLGEFKKRIIYYYNNTMKLQNNVLFITHRNVISVLYNYLNNTKWAYINKKSIPIKHCSLFKINENAIKKEF